MFLALQCESEVTEVLVELAGVNPLLGVMMHLCCECTTLLCEYHSMINRICLFLFMHDGLLSFIPQKTSKNNILHHDHAVKLKYWYKNIMNLVDGDLDCIQYYEKKCL